MDHPFYRETWIEIQLDAIRENVRNLCHHLPKETELMAVVKANGYGHGALEIAETALDAGAQFLAVSLLDEGIFLRKRGITAPILVLGYCPPKFSQLAAEYNISLTVYQEKWIQEAIHYLTKPLNIHLKCDTGMGRIGVQRVEELEQLISTIEKSQYLHIEGIFTHFAAADSLDTSYYQIQRDKFLQFLSVLKEKPRWIHASNSAATLRFKDSFFNLVRSGIAIYGLTPSEEITNELPFPLIPALSLHSKLVHVKKVEKGSKISYGCTYTANEDEWIGTIPIGYADGWLRDLQGQEVLVNGLRVPIVGRICMDQCMIKLPEEMPIGTKVTLIGRQGDQSISADEIAKKRSTINYEIVSTLSSRIPRVYKIGDEVVKITNSLMIVEK